MVEPDKTITEEHPNLLVNALIFLVICVFFLGVFFGFIMGQIII